jgi:hypothetical protein
VVVLSGLSKEETEKNCEAFNVHRYFLKPFNPVDLVNMVQELIENKSFDTYYPMKAV